jgi:hypothetical protein
MHTKEQKNLQSLLNIFNVAGLGQGDLNAGANQLAAMACTLANVSRSGCGIESPGLGRIRAGASLLVSGGFSSSLVTDNIVAELAIRQNNLTAQLRRLIGDKIADARDKKITMTAFPSGPKANPAENAMFQLEQRDSLASLDATEKWAEVVSSPPNPRIDDLAARPKVLVTATGAASLHEQLYGLHGGRPLVALALNRAADVRALTEVCSALLDGLLPDGPGGETVSGNLLFTDPSNILPQIVKPAPDGTTCLGRMLWLVDGDAGPESPLPSDGKVAIGADNMAGRFGDALSRAFGARLNNHDAGTTVHQIDLDAAQIRWVAFLKDTEPRLPGISGAARRLLATLAFGLVELGRGGDVRRLTVSLPQIEAFARFLVLRMASARAIMVESAEEERRNQFTRRIFLRLSEGPLNKRDLYRRLSIDAPFCENLLLEMEADGLVRLVDRGWERIDGATLPAHRNRELTL